MPEASTQKDIFEQIEAFHQEIAEIAEESSTDKNAYASESFSYLNDMLSAIENKHHQGILRDILTKMQELVLKDYSPRLHIGLIMSYELVGSNLGKILIPPLVKRFQGHIKKEIRYLRMQAPDNEFFNGISDKAAASIANLIPLHGKADQQQIFTNALLWEILDYRLSTLDEEAAWDFAAQAILSEINIIS